MNEQNELKKFWLYVSAYYQRALPDPVLRAYCDDCNGVPLDLLNRAFHAHRNGARAEMFPMPATLKNILNPPVDADAEANAVPAAIVNAVQKYGHTNGTAARDAIGEFAWQTVMAFGGWSAVCRMDFDTSVRAQMRDHAKSNVVRTRQGRAHELAGSNVAPALMDGQKTNKNAARLNDVMMALVRGQTDKQNAE